MASPPKPWEINGQPTTQSATAPVSATQNVNPALPERPNTLTTSGVSGMSNLPVSGTNVGGAYGGVGGMGTYGGSGMYGNTGGMYGGGYGTGGYTSGYGGGGYGGYGSGGYGSSYGMNRGMYGGAGAYGGGYGMNRMGMGGRPGMMGPEDISLTQRFEQSTQSTFMVLDQIVQSFAGFSQMLDSTFFATHSSFMAMMGVADQFSQLRTYLGKVFSIMSLVNSIKRLSYRLRGKRMPIDGNELSAASFEEFAKEGPKPSKRPLFVFLMMVVGLPWLFSKLIKKMEARRPGEVRPSDISNLQFCKATYDFASPQPGDLSFKSGELIAILSKSDPATNAELDWWQGRTQDGRMGMFPKTYVAVIASNQTAEPGPSQVPMAGAPLAAGPSPA